MDRDTKRMLEETVNREEMQHGIKDFLNDE
jgi:hypothetical protein